jgi:membrane-bound lytic murein transglycosylase D
VADWNSVGTSATFKAGQQVVVYLPVKTGVRAKGRAGAKSGLRAKAGGKATRSAGRGTASKRRVKTAGN